MFVPEQSTAAAEAGDGDDSGSRRSARFKRLTDTFNKITRKARDFVYGETYPLYL